KLRYWFDGDPTHLDLNGVFDPSRLKLEGNGGDPYILTYPVPTVDWNLPFTTLNTYSFYYYGFAQPTNTTLRPLNLLYSIPPQDKGEKGVEKQDILLYENSLHLETDPNRVLLPQDASKPVPLELQIDGSKTITPIELQLDRSQSVPLELHLDDY